MPETDPVKRMKAAARRGVGIGTVDEQRGWYLEELEQEIGRDASGTWRSANADQNRGNGIAGFIVVLLLLSSLTFAATMAVLFWRDGRFDAYLPAMKQQPNDGARWVIEAPSAETATNAASEPPPNEIEAALNPKPAPPAEAPNDEDAEATE